MHQVTYVWFAQLLMLSLAIKNVLVASKYILSPRLLLNKQIEFLAMAFTLSFSDNVELKILHGVR